MAYKDLHDFKTGSDGDSDIGSIKAYKYALNIVNGVPYEGSSLGSVLNSKGNTLTTFTLPLPFGNFKCIGQCSDIENNAIIYFLYHDTGLDAICRYLITTNTVETILQYGTDPLMSVMLNFQAEHYITSCYVIQNLLYWNDDINPPRKLNIDKAIRFTNGGSGGSDPLSYFYITEQTIDRIKWPPHFSPTCSYQNDNTYNYNNMRGSTFQFAFAYVYDDNELSTLSPITKLPIPQNEETILGTYTSNIHYNNRIDIVLNTGTRTIKAINIYGRSNATDDTPITVSANNSSWYLIDRLEKYDINNNVLINSDNDSYVYQFFNNKIKDIVDQGDAARLFDYVPILCGASELIEKNRLLDGDITEGYDNVDIDIRLTPVKVPVDYSQLIPPYSFPAINLISYGTGGGPNGYLVDLYYVDTFNDYPIANSTVCAITLPPNVNVGDIITVTIVYVYDPTGGTIQGAFPYTYQVVVDNGDVSNYPINLRNKIATQLSLYVPTIIFNNSGNPYYIFISLLLTTSTSFFNIITGIFITGNNVSIATKYKNLKSGAYHEFGLVYYDRGNRSGATNLDTAHSTVYIPFPTEDAAVDKINQVRSGYRNVIDWQIHHIPPIWATHYQWVYTKNTTLNYYLQYHLVGDALAPNTLNSSLNGIYLDAATNKVYMKFQKSLNHYNNYTKKSILSYVWQKGDRVRLLMFPAANGDWYYYQKDDYSAPSSSWTYLTQLDFEIVGVDTGNEHLIVEYFDITQFMVTPITPPSPFYSDQHRQNSVVEVYRPAHEIGERRFYEIGECYEIGNPGLPTRHHDAPAPQQPSNNMVASGIFSDTGDSYLKLRFTSLIDISPNPLTTFNYFPVESDSISDFYVSDSCDIGRPNIVDRNMKQRRLQANLRFSGQLLQDTQINDLSRFDVLNAEQLPDKFGVIEKIVEVADVIKVVMNTKLISIYVGRTSTGEADGSSNLYVTSGVLGTIIIPAVSHGTKHPESVSRWDRYLYFFDLLNGEFVRDTANGIFTISSYGQAGYFRTWKEQIFTAQSFGGISRVISAFDKRTEQVVVSLFYEYDDGEKSVVRKDTIAFLENKDEVQTVFSNQWKTNYSFTPEYFGYTGTALTMFQDGQLWLAHSNPIHCSFFGQKYPEKITIVCNISPDTIKRFLAFAYSSNKRWSVESIYIPPTENYPQGMLSSIVDTKFVSKEGYFYSEFNKNILTPGFATQLEALINGFDLRGAAMEITLRNDHDDSVSLDSCYVTLLPSPKSGVE